jgi:hypothetical protein
MWTYAAYRWPDQAAYTAALAALGWQDGAPHGVDLLASGTLYGPPVGDDTPGETLPGWHVAAAFRDQAAPAAWAAMEIDAPDAMPVLGRRPPVTLADYQAAVEVHVAAVAASRGYRSPESCASYAVSTVSAWAAEAAAFIAWRDQVWIKVHETLAAVQGGAPAPTVAGLIAGLPAMVWPA